MTGPSYADDLDRQGERWSRNRRRWIRAMVLLYLTVPFWSHGLYSGPHSLSAPKLAFLAAATAGMMALTSRRLAARGAGARAGSPGGARPSLWTHEPAHHDR